MAPVALVSGSPSLKAGRVGAQGQVSAWAMSAVRLRMAGEHIGLAAGIDPQWSFDAPISDPHTRYRSSSKRTTDGHLSLHSGPMLMHPQRCARRRHCVTSIDQSRIEFERGIAPQSES